MQRVKAPINRMSVSGFRVLDSGPLFRVLTPEPRTRSLITPHLERERSSLLWIGALVGLWLLAGTFLAAPSIAFGAGSGDGCTATTCDAPAPACDQTTSGTDNCGSTCSKTGPACCIVATCDAPAPACDQTTWGTDNCGKSCSKTGPACCTFSSCNATAPACDQTTWGTDNCGKSCSKTGAVCCTATTCDALEPACGKTTWGKNDCGKSCSKTGPVCVKQPYGFVVPSDPHYGFYKTQYNMNDGWHMWENEGMSSVGLAAKGNIIIGDYTTDAFKTRVVPKLQADNEDTVTQPYVVDPTDVSLGYDSLQPNLCGGRSPCFDGNYDAEDGGKKLDGSPRKFYESTLPDDEFRALVDPKLRISTTPLVTIDSVLFTNHALAGVVNAQKLTIDGAMVARDDALIFGQKLEINHDIRLIGNTSATGLPMSLRRSTLIKWEECPSTGCP